MINRGDYLGMETEKGWDWFQEQQNAQPLTTLDEVIDAISMQEFFSIIFLCIALYFVLLSYKKIQR